MYYTVVVYLHIHEYAETQAGPNFTRKPQIADFWISVLSAFAVYYLQKWTTDWLIPIIGRVSEYKPLESKELKHEKSKKAAEKIYKTFWHMGCAIGAYLLFYIKLADENNFTYPLTKIFEKFQNIKS